MEPINNNNHVAELTQALQCLRQQIKDREKKETGRTPTVCSNDAIQKMIQLMPKKASDFYSIQGIGPAFVENYAAEFLTVLHGENPLSEETLNNHVEDTLRLLSKKLINITKNNRILNIYQF